jgi:hypothetical protein
MEIARNIQLEKQRIKVERRKRKEKEKEQNDVRPLLKNYLLWKVAENVRTF